VTVPLWLQHALPEQAQLLLAVFACAGVAPDPRSASRDLKVQAAFRASRAWSKFYVAGLFDAEGCVYFKHHCPCDNDTITYLNLSLAQKQDNLLLATLLPFLEGWVTHDAGYLSAHSMEAVISFIEDYVLSGLLLRKGFKLFSVATSFFGFRSASHGQQRLAVDWGFIKPCADYPPSFPSSGTTWESASKHEHAVLASRYKAYMKYGLVRCDRLNAAIEDANGDTTPLKPQLEGATSVPFAATAATRALLDKKPASAQ